MEPSGTTTLAVSLSAARQSPYSARRPALLAAARRLSASCRCGRLEPTRPSGSPSIFRRQEPSLRQAQKEHGRIGWVARFRLREIPAWAQTCDRPVYVLGALRSSPRESPSAWPTQPVREEHRKRLGQTTRSWVAQPSCSVHGVRVVGIFFRNFMFRNVHISKPLLSSHSLHDSEDIPISELDDRSAANCAVPHLDLRIPPLPPSHVGTTERQDPSQSPPQGRAMYQQRRGVF